MSFFVAIPTTEGNESFCDATQADLMREGFQPHVFTSKGKPKSRQDAMERIADNYRAILRAFLSSHAAYLVVVEDDVCLAPGFAKWPHIAWDLDYAAASFGVLSKNLIEPATRVHAMAGTLPQGFYPMVNRKSAGYYWGGQAVAVSKRFARRMLEIYPGITQPFDNLAGRTAYQHKIKIYGLIPSPIRHMRMKTGARSHSNLQMVSYRGVYECPIHEAWPNIERSWEEREA